MRNLNTVLIIRVIKDNSNIRQISFGVFITLNLDSNKPSTVPAVIFQDSWAFESVLYYPTNASQLIFTFRTTSATSIELQSVTLLPGRLIKFPRRV